MASIAPVKAHFTSAGFEVHAPLGSTFGIAGPQTLFERIFGVALEINDQDLVTSITVEGGGVDLPFDSLPEDIRSVVEAIRFIAPPPLLFG